MEHHPIDELLPRAGGSVYKLVRMAANRALELADGKPALIAKIKTDKLTTIALEEIAQGKIECVNGAKKSPEVKSKKQEDKEDKEDQES